MLGDNMYGRQQPQDFVDKFERPYAPLLQAGVPLLRGARQSRRPRPTASTTAFNMGGERYYTFARNNVRFFVLDTNLHGPDAARLDRRHAERSRRRPGRSATSIIRSTRTADATGRTSSCACCSSRCSCSYGVDVVFAGHEHVYERITPQKGITYFVDGSGGQLRKGDVTPSAMTAACFDQDQTFMLVEIAGDDMFFQAISRTGRVVDSGVIHRRPTT